jgi:DNA polymerase-3 subunit chi
MTRVDFYVLSQPEQSVDFTACRLTEKAYAMGHRVLLQVASPAHAATVDNLLWTFRQGSFVPHECYQPGREPAAPVMVGHDADPILEPDVLINLCPAVPLFFSRFERVIEIVGPDPEARESSRVRFRFYRERGYPLHTHNL